MLELLLILAVLLLVFGAKKLRTAGSDLGAAVKGFRRALRGRAPAAGPATPIPAVPGAAARTDAKQPDAEFPEVLAARARRGSGGPRA